jgi:hypothetical protein
MNKETFAEQFRQGKVTSDQIDDFIETWHNSEEDISLIDFLGITEDQYARWIEGAELEDLFMEKK